MRLPERKRDTRTTGIGTQPADLERVDTRRIVGCGRKRPCKQPYHCTKDTHSSRSQRSSKSGSSSARVGQQTKRCRSHDQEMRALRRYQNAPMESWSGWTENTMQRMWCPLQSRKAPPTSLFSTRRRYMPSEQTGNEWCGSQSYQCYQTSQSVDPRSP